MKKLLASTAVMLALALPAMAQDYTPDPNAKPGGVDHRHLQGRRRHARPGHRL